MPAASASLHPPALCCRLSDLHDHCVWQKRAGVLIADDGSEVLLVPLRGGGGWAPALPLPAKYTMPP